MFYIELYFILVYVYTIKLDFFSHIDMNQLK